MFDLKRKLNETEDRLTMHVCTIPSATVTQAIAAAGADAVIVDMEHGAVDYASAHAMIAATAGTPCAPLVRVARTDADDVKRVLDLGAEGIVYPMVRTGADAERAVAALRYPPAGTRGFGPFIAHSHAQVPFPDYLPAVGDNLVCCLLAETRDAVENIEEICAVPGIDRVSGRARPNRGRRRGRGHSAWQCRAGWGPGRGAVRARLPGHRRVRYFVAESRRRAGPRLDAKLKSAHAIWCAPPFPDTQLPCA